MKAVNQYEFLSIIKINERNILIQAELNKARGTNILVAILASLHNTARQVCYVRQNLHRPRLALINQPIAVIEGNTNMNMNMNESFERVTLNNKARWTQSPVDK